MSSNSNTSTTTMLVPFKGQQMKFKRQRRIGVSVKALRDIVEVGPRLTCLGRGVVTVVLVTSNTAKIHRFQLLLSAATSGLAFDSMAHDEQVRSIATQCLLDRIGWFTTH